MSGMVQETTATLTNLLAAFEGESNAHAKYALFAVKADEEGWHGAASLFRAAARSEQIHASNHARVIQALRGKVLCEIHPVEVKSTLENLRTALAGELYEIETMYPGFVTEVKAADSIAASRSFQWAMEAEKTHARLFQDAIDGVLKSDPNAWVRTAREFYVCAACGYTTETPEEEERCPVCNVPWERFEVIR